MSLYKALIDQKECLSVIGLGYVGMPIAVEFAKKGIHVIGFDLNAEKIHLYESGVDPTREVGDEQIKNTSVQFTAEENDLKRAKFHIVAVPTPVNTDRPPCCLATLLISSMMSTVLPTPAPPNRPILPPLA